MDGLSVVFMGEMTNLCMSWFEVAVKFPIKVTQVAPIGYEANSEIINKLNLNSIGQISVSNNINCIDNTTDLIYTDCWPEGNDEDNKIDIRNAFLPYQITDKILDRTNDNAVFLPCPPVTRGQEVSAKAMQSDRCMNFKAKHYLLHVQNAVMEMAVLK